MEANKPDYAAMMVSLLKRDGKHLPDFRLHEIVYARLVKDFSFTPRRGTIWRNYAVQVLKEIIEESLTHLESLVNKGDREAIELYAVFTHKMVKRLNFWALSTKKEELKPFARKCFSWPARISRRKAFRDDADELIRELGVGKDNAFANDTAARFNPNSKFGKCGCFELTDGGLGEQ